MDRKIMHMKHQITSEKQKVSVIIPTFNEEYSIKRVLNLIPHNELMNLTEVIVVDGGSKDGTLEIAKALGADVKLQEKTGYGIALLDALSMAKGDVLVFIDGDGVYDPRDIPTLLRVFESEKADLVIGSRFLGKIMPGTLSSTQLFGNKIFNAIYRILSGDTLTDVFSGFFIINKTSFTKVKKYLSDVKTPSDVHISLVSAVRKNKGKIVEAPITFYPRINKSKMARFKYGHKILSSILLHGIVSSSGED